VPLLLARLEDVAAWHGRLLPATLMMVAGEKKEEE
jgi:hypothetical protein